uniref:SH3 domain-containing protein n=3 Tax=Steinernema glaseri TaxID=37863 RepID=A0A1I7ZUI9_9BILA
MNVAASANSAAIKGRSSSWTDPSHSLSYTITGGLRTIYHGSAFLPAFVIDGFNAMLDDAGFEFVNWCIRSIEEKGIREQGIYRNCGVTSKVQKMMQVALDKRKTSAERMAFGEEIEWETKTISSAIKTFLRNLPEPLMTFELHHQFINAAKMDDQKERVGHIHYYVHQLPESHRRMLEIIIRHLRRVADRHTENLMTVGNLGVCFGPTLLRPKEETMAAIMDIKFCNVVVEVLIAHSQTIFGSAPPPKLGAPCPPKPLHSLGSSSTNHSKAPISPKTPASRSFEPSGLTRPKTIAPQPPIRLRPAAETHVYDSVPEPSLEASTSASTTPGEQQRLNNVENSPSASPKGKPGGSGYAASYNAFPSESLFSKFQKRHSGGNLLGSSGCSPSTTFQGASTRSMSTSLIAARPNPFFRSLIRQEAQPSRRVKTLYACTAGHETELTFAPNQIITNVYESKEEGWLVGTLNGKTGLIPANYVSWLTFEPGEVVRVLEPVDKTP